MLTLSTLTLAGAIFVAVLSVWQSTVKTLDDTLTSYNYDVEVNLGRSYRSEEIASAVALVPGVTDFETVYGTRFGECGLARTRFRGTTSPCFAFPGNTSFVRPTLLEGRWLLPDDKNAVVVNTSFLRDEPDVKLGDKITFKFDTKDTTWRVVGVAKGLLSGSLVYANQPYFLHLTNNPGHSTILWVVGAKHDPAAQSQLAQALEAQFKARGMRVQQTQTITFIRDNAQGQFNIVVVLLLVMAILLAVVGGLGLMGTMS